MEQGIGAPGGGTARPVEPPGALERSITVALGVCGLHSLKSKMTALALIATLLPSLTMGGLFYAHNKRLLQDKITQELQSITSQASREVDLRVRERLYDVRVFSTSSVVAETTDCLLSASVIGCGSERKRLENYLASVCARFTDYEELLVLDPEGHVLATSAAQAGAVVLPQNWIETAKADKPILGEPRRDETLAKGVIVIAEPIRSLQDRFVGLLAAKLNFEGFDELLLAYAVGASSNVRLIDREGRSLIGSADGPVAFLEPTVSPAVAHELFAHEGAPQEYEDARSSVAVGSLKRLQQLDWGVLAQLDRQTAYAQIARLRNITFVLVLGLMLTVGLAAWLLGLTVVGPLDRLARGSARVAGGDLTIELPVLGRGEVTYLTDAFNHMVQRLARGRSELDATNETLRQKNAELEALSTTDSLTGLHNRHSLMSALSSEVERARRLERSLGLLMIDVDHFKRYNDSRGHLAGDEMLRKVARLLESELRDCDLAARYGGEEFVVVLPETERASALEVAERIRRSAESATREGADASPVTLSVGVARYPESASTPEALLHEADAAMYEAKRLGRNRVVEASCCEEMRGQLP